MNNGDILIEVEQGDIALSCDSLCFLIARIENEIEKYCGFDDMIDKPIKIRVKNKGLRIGSEFDNSTKKWGRCKYE